MMWWNYHNLDHLDPHLYLNHNLLLLLLIFSHQQPLDLWHLHLLPLHLLFDLFR